MRRQPLTGNPRRSPSPLACDVLYAIGVARFKPDPAATWSPSAVTALGRLLQERREAFGYSRSRLAEAVGIAPGTLEGWELGRVAKPPIHDVLRLARFLRIELDELEAAVLDEVAEPAAPPPPADDGPRLLERAIDLLGWSEADAAAALGVPRTR